MLPPPVRKEQYSVANDEEKSELLISCLYEVWIRLIVTKRNQLLLVCPRQNWERDQAIILRDDTGSLTLEQSRPACGHDSSSKRGIIDRDGAIRSCCARKFSTSQVD